MRRAGRENATFMNDGDAVAELFNLAHDVRGKDDALALAAEQVDRVEHGPGHEHVEPGGRLVEDQHGRIVNDRAGDRHLLLHAGRHLRAEHVAEFLHLQLGEDLVEPLRKAGLFHAVEAGEIFDQLPGGHAVVDARVSRHEADAGANFGRLSQHVVAGYGGDATGRLEHGAQHAEAGGLACAVRSQQSEDLAGPHVERHVFERDDAAAAEVRKEFGNVLDVNHQGSARVTALAARLIQVYRVTRGAQQRTSPRRLGNPTDTPPVQAT